MVGLNLLKSTSVRRSALRLHSSRPTNSSHFHSTLPEGEHYWSKITPWKDVSAEDFVSYRFQLRHTVNNTPKLERFLFEVLPNTVAQSRNPLLQQIRTKEDFIEDAIQGLKIAPMAIRLTPQILSRVDWENPLDDPIRRQFLPLKSAIIRDHPALTLDSLNEEADSPVPGLVHRYPGRALFLATSICPVYCRFCTRSYAVGAPTNTVSKSPQKPVRKRWELVFQHIEKDTSIQDIVVSGGDAYYLTPEDIRAIGERLLDIPHIRRFRLASKGLAVAPGRILDKTDPWADTLIELSNRGRQVGKQVCLHTHFNHPNEITWITRKAADELFKQGVIMRNQSVLLRGVNDDFQTMGNLIKALADMNIQPYYVYQCDLVRGIEDLRTPLQTILDMDKYIRGTFSGFMMPSFVVDLPGGGGKRLASTVEKYDKENGVSYWRAPGLPGAKGKKIYQYFDPQPLRDDVDAIKSLHDQQQIMAEQRSAQLDGLLDKRLPGTSSVEDAFQYPIQAESSESHEKSVASAGF